MTDPPSISVRNLWKIFGPRPTEAITLHQQGKTRSEILAGTGCTIGVRDVSFEVRPSETFVVMGLSGSGKSTLVRCVSRLTDTTSGTVLIDGEDVTQMDEGRLRELRRAKLSMVFQHFGLFPHRRVIDNAAYGLEIQGVPKTERHKKTLAVLDTVGLHGFEYHYPQQLSGGMQQRVGLARALAVDPQIMFFDEPFSALDPLIRRDMQDELIRLQQEMKRTIVFITHDFAEAIKLGDRIAIMKDGAFDQVGTPAELITHPATDYVREFTKDIPKVKVLTAGDVMHSQTEPGWRNVAVTDPIERFVPLLLDDPRPLTVIDDQGRVVGQVDRAAVSSMLGAD